jgi:hypothetical protein
MNALAWSLTTQQTRSRAQSVTETYRYLTLPCTRCMLKVWASNILVKVTLVKDDDNMDVSTFMSRAQVHTRGRCCIHHPHQTSVRVAGIPSENRSDKHDAVQTARLLRKCTTYLDHDMEELLCCAVCCYIDGKL